MAQPTFAVHGTYQQDGQGNAFLTYLSQTGSVVFQIGENGQLAVVDGLTSAGVGSPVVVAAVSASLGFAVFNTAAAVNLLPATAPAGTYRVSLYMVTTTTFVTNTEEVITFGWTDDDQAQTLAFTTGALTAGTTLVGSQLIRSAGTAAITYTPSKTGTAATAGVNALSIVVERLI